MGGKKKKGSNVTPGSQSRVSMTLREESSRKKQVNVNAKSMCKLDHLKNLAVASIPSLGAFFGERLAATTEALGLRADPSLFACERCESNLQPGDNCTVRIEKNKSKVQHRRKKSNPTTHNNVVYRCHFCFHRNLMRGTPKGCVKQIFPPKPKPPRKLEPGRHKYNSSAQASTSIPEVNKADTIALAAIDDGPATPVPISGLSLLDSKRRKRNRSGVKKVAEPQTSSNAADAEKSRHASSKRREKAWTSLKEIAQSSEKKVSDLSIPFFIMELSTILAARIWFAKVLLHSILSCLIMKLMIPIFQLNICTELSSCYISIYFEG